MITIPKDFKPFYYQLSMARRAGKNTMCELPKWTVEGIAKLMEDAQEHLVKKTKPKGGNMSLVFVDCEASGPCPGCGDLTEFGAVIHKTKKTFYGDLRNKTPFGVAFVFECFLDWLETNCESRPVFVSDNPAFDWQWINYYFHHTMGKNPFGWSARRIGDYYAGLQGDFHKACSWKKLRVTKHDHNPVNDAMGNVEAFDKMQLNYKVDQDKIKNEPMMFHEFDGHIFEESAGGTP